MTKTCDQLLLTIHIGVSYFDTLFTIFFLKQGILKPTLENIKLMKIDKSTLPFICNL
uniref:Uncharacterized protein n=1 Tax=Arundo donax TaxID=35708 RepID=A0A0A9EJD3_ARUDO